jgi:hypothetical protein
VPIEEEGEEEEEEEEESLFNCVAFRRLSAPSTGSS